MKILLATDGSPSAQHAEELVVRTTWPDGSEIDVLHVDLLADIELDTATEHFIKAHSAVRHLGEERLAALVERLRAAGRTIRSRTISGRPATAIVAHAERLGADLVVVGSHNHGALASFTLGSVSAEVVDHAPCPVLVARRSALGPIVLGTDGSPGALRAESLLATWPFLAKEQVHVVSVSRLLPPWYATAETGGAPAIDGVIQQLLDEGKAESERLANEAVGRLTSRGVAAQAMVVQGTAGDGLLDAVNESNAQLVVVGSRGNTGLTRLLVGSVARSILYRAPCSVLIVRDKKPLEQHWRAMERVGTAV